jgi:hypothetical protein
MNAFIIYKDGKKYTWRRAWIMLKSRIFGDVDRKNRIRVDVKLLKTIRYYISHPDSQLTHYQNGEFKKEIYLNLENEFFFATFVSQGNSINLVLKKGADGEKSAIIEKQVGSEFVKLLEKDFDSIFSTKMLKKDVKIKTLMNEIIIN